MVNTKKNDGHIVHICSMKINSHELLGELMRNTREILQTANELENIDAATLQYIPGEKEWSIAQVLAHLNFYSTFYLPAIARRIHQHPGHAQPYFTPGWLGNYFTKMMQPTKDNQVKNKMKTMKAASPASTINAGVVLKQFIQDQHSLLQLLQQAKSVNINKLRVPISLTPLIQLKLGDTFRFLIAHEQRHVVQINHILFRQKGQLLNAG